MMDEFEKPYKRGAFIAGHSSVKVGGGGIHYLVSHNNCDLPADCWYFVLCYPPGWMEYHVFVGGILLTHWIADK